MTTTTMRINYNDTFKGIEVSFDKKPSASVLTTLKANGFRWHRVKQLWYAKDNQARRETVTEIYNTMNGIKAPKQAPKKAKTKEVENAYGIKVGDIYYMQYGYSMTLYDFFQVVSVTEKTCRVVEINASMVGGDAWRPQLQVECGVKHAPRERSQWIKDQVKGDVKHPQTWRDEVYLSIGDHHASKYEGQVLEEDHWD